MGKIPRRYRLLLAHHLAMLFLWAASFVLPSPFAASVFAVLVLLHLALPVSSAWVARRRTREAMLLGPGVPVALYALVLLKVLIGLHWGNPEDYWLTLMLVILAAAALALYAGYSMAAFSYAHRLFNRKRQRR